MTHTYLTLESVSYVLPTGITLFSDLNVQLDQRVTGLVGRNGVGKSTLARILAGLVQPSSGRCTRTGGVYYLAQQIPQRKCSTVASLVSVQAVLDAMQRIIELSSLGLSSYGGHYGFYLQSKALQQHAAIERLELFKHERKREGQSMRRQVERQERRNAQGSR